MNRCVILSFQSYVQQLFMHAIPYVIYWVAHKKRLKLCVTITERILYGNKFSSVHL